MSYKTTLYLKNVKEKSFNSISLLYFQCEKRRSVASSSRIFSLELNRVTLS